MFFSQRCSILSLVLAAVSPLAADELPRGNPLMDVSWKISILASDGGNGSVSSVSQAVALNDQGPVLTAQKTDPVPETAVQSSSPVEVPVKGSGSDAKITSNSAVMNGDPAHVPPSILPAMSYVEAYRSVPFSRTEYEANPGYRHETAMELMFQQLRPMTVMKQNTPRVSRYPDFYQYPYARYPYTRVDVRQSWGAYGIPYPLYAR